MSAAQDENSIGMNWLVDSSALLKDGNTRVIFYNPQDELQCHDRLFNLEGMTVEEIARRRNSSPEFSYEQVCEFAKCAKLGLLYNWLDL
ncbi:hypothetical protein LCGC14_0074450 [marine sediment metagenome]|uniref:Uncharacterized protein n=1 Tax=marine sediment metagenome TaxID=412755 RepID=A0A0F9YMG1_9ZZZZ|nr:hypothetical protein [Halomonas sp.]HDZ48788.1 hypothetical protein [Halomonas sp.]HEB05453.1 hypothetical protein [Halomonas sp.]